MIETFHLGKSFGPVRAVVDLNLKTHPGEIFGFLGPNGAGKSAIIKLVTGLLTLGTAAVKFLGLAAALVFDEYNLWRGGFLSGVAVRGFDGEAAGGAGVEVRIDGGEAVRAYRDTPLQKQ